MHGTVASTRDSALQPGARESWLHYAVAVSAVALATLVRIPFEPLLHGTAPYALYFPVLAALAWFSGVGATTLAAVVSPLAAWHFTVRDADAAYAASIVLYLFTATALISLSRSAAKARASIERALHTARRAERGANAAVWDWDLSSDSVRGPELGRLFGLEESEPLSHEDLLTRVHHEDRERVARALEAAAEGTRSFDVELRVRHPRLGERWVSWMGELERDEDGRPSCVTGLALDITDRKHAEESRARLAAIVASSADAIIGEDLDGRILSWNAAAERMFGYRAEEVIGRSIELLTPPDRRAEQAVVLEQLRGGQAVEPLETVRITRHGARIDVSVTFSPIRDGEGRTIGAAKIARDISARKRTERALAEQREWFRITLASIGDAVITADRAGLVTFLNPIAERLTGWPLADALGKPIHRVFHIVNEQTREPIESPCGKVLRTGGIVDLSNHTALIGRDGREHPIEDSAAPIIDDQRNVIGVVMVFHDVTERRHVEVERRSRERERERLLESERAARSEAERANRLKDDFVATLSHELRTPLNAILGWTEIVQRAPQNAETLARGLTVIERNTRVQAQLISDLLDMSTIVSGKIRLERRLVSLSNVVDDAIDTVRALADAKDVVIDRVVAPGLQPILGDPSRLQQVVWNLLANAVKFSSVNGRVRVEVTREQAHAVIRVSDEGAGIRADFLPYIFDRFRQQDASTTRRFGGLGLGLTIVKQLVELHGGSVAAHSEGEARGSTFVVQLPLDAAEPHAAANAPRSPTLPAIDVGAAEGLANTEVLVVEDDTDAREMVERVLGEAGCRVVAVGAAGAAMEALSAQRPDVIISDIGLPDEDGYSLIERVRKHLGASGMVLPAIALTAFARPEDRTRALRAGFQAHLAKPVDPGELLAVTASFARLVHAGRSASS